MNLGRIGLIGGAAALGTAALAACTLPKPSDKLVDGTPDALAANYVAQYDKNADRQINLEFETTVEGGAQSRCSSRDIFGDFDCLQTETYVDVSSMIRLAQAADARGDKDGNATEGEIAAVIATFDTGSPEDPGTAEKRGTSNGRLERAEAEAFLQVMPETNGRRVTDRDTHWLEYFDE